MEMYKVNPDTIIEKHLPSFVKGISSFNKDLLLTAVEEEDILKEEVVCISLSDLIEQNDFKSFDFLQIDAEGYDYEIIINFNFSLSKPKIISFEHGLLDGNRGTPHMDDSRFQKVKEILHKNGYELWVDKYDAVAFIPGFT